MRAEGVPAGPLAVARGLPGLLRRVAGLLAQWQARAAAIPDAELRRQAEASLTRKRFHCEGGAVYALAAGPASEAALRFIIALQTISDYLDNLCDRSPAGGEEDLALLHTAMLQGVQAPPPAGAGPPDRFYRLHPHRADGGYLDALVRTCQAEVAALPAAAQGPFTAEAGRLVGWYCALQVTKHLPAGREEAVQRFAQGLQREAPGLPWWEIAAATGSTLGVFALFAAAAGGRLDAALARRLAGAYFPWVTGLHILLDYFIDRAEDRAGGDLNFTFSYASAGAGAARLRLFGRRAAAAVAGLPDAGFHRTIVRGLPALYLADPKVSRQGLRRQAFTVLHGAGPSTWLLYWAVRWMRAQAAPRLALL